MKWLQLLVSGLTRRSGFDLHLVWKPRGSMHGSVAPQVPRWKLRYLYFHTTAQDPAPDPFALPLASWEALADSLRSAYPNCRCVSHSTRYNITHRLSHFFSEPREFSSIQSKCGALVCGAFARGFLSPTISNVDQIKIAVKERRTEPLDHYLESEGYRYGVGKHKKRDANGRTLIVWVMERYHACIAIVFADARTTANLNVVSWKKAYSIFVHATYM